MLSFLPACPPAVVSARLLSIALTCFLLSGCGAEGDDVTVEDVDQSTSVTATEEELARFTPRSDSVLTDEQVAAYLRTSLLQFDMIREESQEWREAVARMEQREQKGGAVRQFQNMMEAGRTLAGAADLIGGSYVRAARTLGYNPAEMEWVQERMAEVSSHLMLKPMRQQALDAAAEIRAQAEALRAMQATGSAVVPGTEEQIGNLLATAEELEAQPSEEASRSATRNEEVLKRARPAVTEEMWAAIGFAGGASGLAALTGWGDPDDPEMEKKLDELRQIYQAALENRAVAAMPGS